MADAPVPADDGPRGGASLLLRGFDALIDVSTALMFLIGAVAMFAMVVTRYGFAWSDASVEILVRYSMIWGTFIGISAGVRFGINIRFTLLEHVLGDFGKKIVQTIGLVLTLAIAIGLAISGESFMDETMMFNEVMPTALRWPVWPFHAAIFGGGILLSLQALRSLADLWRRGGHAVEDASDAGAF